MILARKKHKLTNIVIALVILIIISVISVVFLSQAIISKSEEFSHNQVLLQNIEKDNDKLENLKLQYEEVRNDISKIESALPDKKNLLPFIRDIESMALSNNLEIFLNFETIKTTASTNNEPGELIQINLKGKYPDIVMFIDNLENSKYFIEVKNIDIIVLSSDDQIYESAMNLKLFTRD